MITKSIYQNVNQKYTMGRHCCVDCAVNLGLFVEHNVKKAVLSAPSKKRCSNDQMSEILYITTVLIKIFYQSQVVLPIENYRPRYEPGIITTVHAATASQNVVDSREKSGKKWRIGRSILNNIIPTTTGATKSVERVYPNVKGKLSGTSIRVPVDNESLATLTVHLDKATNKDEILKMVQKYSEGEMQNILSYTTELLVSSDLNGNTHSCIYDANGTVQVNENFYTFLCWYDNECGYSARLVDVLQKMFQ